MKAASMLSGVTDRPILFSAPMVRALLDGAKTQTRRALKPQPFESGYFEGEIECNEVPGYGSIPKHYRFSAGAVGGGAVLIKIHEPRFAIGDRLWVREALEQANGEAVGYPADGSWLPNTSWVWKRKKLAPIHMPRGLSRLTLTVTDVRVERLQDISEADAIAEGVRRILPRGHPDDRGPYHFAVDVDCGSLSAVNAADAYASLWNHINGPDAWEANPWVVAVSFSVERRNIDAAGDIA